MKGKDILTTDQPRWRCVDKHESAMKELFYICLNGTTMNNLKGYTLKLQINSTNMN